MSQKNKPYRYLWWTIFVPPLLLVFYGVQFMVFFSAARADLATTVGRIRILTAIEGALLEHRDTPSHATRTTILRNLSDFDEMKMKAGFTELESGLVPDLRSRFDPEGNPETLPPISGQDLMLAVKRVREAVAQNRRTAGRISVTLEKAWNYLEMLVFGASLLAIALSILLLRYRRLHLEQRETKRELVKREHRYRRLVETSSDLVWKIDCQGRWTFLNRSATVQNLGHTVEELLGRHFWDDSGASVDADREIVRRLLAGESIVGYESTRFKNTGEVITLRWNGVPVLDEAGTVVGASGTAADLTDLKQVETALRHREARLRLHHSIATMSASRASVREIIMQAVEQLFEMFPAYRSTYCTVNPNGQISVLACCQPPSMPNLEGMTADVTYAPEHFDRLKTDSVIPISNLLEDKKLTPLVEQFTNASIAAMLDVPLKHSDSLIGLICLDSSEVHEWTASEIETLTGVSKALAVAIHNAQSEEARRDAETALRESENRFRQLAENIDQVFWLSDVQNRRVIYVSPAYETIWGRPRESVYQSPLSWTDTIHPDDREHVVSSFQGNAINGEYDVEYRILRDDGKVRWIHDRSIPIRTKNDSILRVAGVSTDITERKLAERRLNEHKEELAHASRLSALGEMATTLAHELNQPMCAISSYSQACMHLLDNQNTGNGELVEVLGKVSGQAQRAGKIIRRINEFARKGSLRMARTDLSRIIDNALELIRAGASRSGVRILFDKPSKPVYVSVDRLQIEQVVLNLIRNALDALQTTLQRDRLVRITVNRKEPETVEVYVSDNGSGIALITSEKAFKPFFTTKATGVGLGLSISQSIVEAHGGQLTLEPGANEGAVAQFTLPAVGER